MMRNGYKRVPSRQQIYKQDVAVNNIIFSVKVIIHDAYFDQWPSVFLEEIPEQLPYRLPHVLCGLNLCYLDTSSVALDRYSFESNMALVLEQTTNLLEQFVKSPELLQNEFRRELSYYWKGQLYSSCYLLSEVTKNSTFLIFNRKTLTADEDTFEIVVAEDLDDINKWYKKRNGIDEMCRGPAFFIDLPNDVTLPENSWPPENFDEVLEWLRENGGVNTVNKLLDNVFSCLSKSLDVVGVFNFHDIKLGVLLRVPFSSAYKLLKEAGTSRRKGVNPQVKKALIRNAIKANNSSFYRLSFDDSSADYVTGRNLVGRNSLKGVRVAQIGCGTVGGAAAQMLVQAGAGINGGSFDLYDTDTLKSENLGRHVLGVSYLGENKADAMSHWLSINHVGTLELNSITSIFDPTTASSLYKKYDLIVDATGDHQFSTSLCHYMHRAENPLPVIYGWVDAGGLIARSLLDDGDNKYACYYCIFQRQDNIFKDGVERQPWQPRACGLGSFMPFSSQASFYTAGFIQQSCLDWTNGKSSPRLKHYAIDQEQVMIVKNKDMKAVTSCVCCSFQ